jgi:hypothetical protein
MEVAGMALAIIGYALFYTGASNLFTGGKGWGFLQSLLNKGEANNSGAFANLMPGSSDSSGDTGSFLGNLTSGVLGTLTGGLL